MNPNPSKSYGQDHLKSPIDIINPVMYRIESDPSISGKAHDSRLKNKFLKAVDQILRFIESYHTLYTSKDGPSKLKSISNRKDSSKWQ